MTFGLATVGNDAVLVRDDRFVPLTHWGERRDLHGLLADWDAALPQMHRWAADEAAFASALGLADADVRAPYRPGQVFCTGANYKKHVVGLVMGDPSMRNAEAEAMSEDERRRRVEEMMDARANADPYCFIKLPSCVVGPRDAVVLPRNVAKPDWELELGVVIGKRTRHITAERAMIVPRQFVADPYDLTITLSVNGKVYQNESTRDMMVSIERQIAYLSDRVELMPGDVICTGSPYGNGSAFGVFLQPGDEMEGSITGLGTQRNRCVAEGAG